MRKPLWLSLILLGSGLAGGIPYYTGVIAEQQFTVFQSTFPPGEARLASAEFHRGWLDSEADTRFVLADGRSLTLHHHMEHGLAPVSPPVWHTTVTDAEGLPPLPLRVDTYISLTGPSTALLNMPAYEWEHAGFHLRSEGLRGRVKFGQDRFKGELSGPLWAFELAGEAVSLSGGAFEFGGQAQEGALQTRLEGGLEEGVYHPVYLPQPVALAEIKTALSFYQQAALLSGQLALEAKPASGGTGQLQLHIERLDSEALAALLQALALPADQPSRAWSLMQAATALSASQPRIRLETLHLDTPAGALTGHLSLRQQSPEGAEPPANFLLALPYLEVDGEFVLPRGVVEGFAEWQLRRAFFQRGEPLPADIEGLARSAASDWLRAAQAYLVEEQGSYRLSFSLRQGKLQINGRETPLAALFSQT